MRPDEPPRAANDTEGSLSPVLDADLARLDDDLRAAGRQASLALRGRTQPTRWYSIELRSRLRQRLGPVLHD